MPFFLEFFDHTFFIYYSNSLSTLFQCELCFPFSFPGPGVLYTYALIRNNVHYTIKEL
ncbi:hypothetical protein JHK82_041673 [Glycine max]|uniref:Uncharacterized protein n=1 Tax=Glycine max TaxID=3847 RepID=A0A0R0FXA6_SOYBN|nr:hypothetical protein JHK85_042341 [Glycine max]KAG5104703.1 hypothetical protein JHK82_041673 [Glycine max]KAH1146114.1 hypothetical protein GYH30_041670 [Glycine max]KRH10928.1 hypothetical protein GLYMA_15G077200v4 [Glycine max]